jgi:hypothetical protein
MRYFTYNGRTGEIIQINYVYSYYDHIKISVVLFFFPKGLQSYFLILWGVLCKNKIHWKGAMPSPSGVALGERGTKGTQAKGMPSCWEP